MSSGAPSWEHIPVLLAPSELESFPGLQATDEQHIADPDGILARYEFSTEVRCSLKRRHPHRTGVVVRTLCDLILCMGRQCGKKSIVGFDDVHRSVERRVRFQRNADYLQGWVDRFSRRMEHLQRPLQAREDLVATMRQQLPELEAELRRRLHEGTSGTEVRISAAVPPARSAEERRPAAEERVFRLSGLVLFRQDFSRLRRLKSALAAFQEKQRTSPPIDAPSARELGALAKSADERADAAEVYLRETAVFLTERNLQLALTALGRGNSVVHVERRGWRVGYFPGRSALLSLPDAPALGSTS